ncbi:hypothetical protein C8J57DRAFT_1310172, partial [Mycena rebaudengoi]
RLGAVRQLLATSPLLSCLASPLVKFSATGGSPLELYVLGDIDSWTLGGLEFISLDAPIYMISQPIFSVFPGVSVDTQVYLSITNR